MVGTGEILGTDGSVGESERLAKGSRYQVLKCRANDMLGFATTLPVSTADIANPPTAAQLTTAFGAPAAVGAGFAAMVDDNNAHTAEYLVWSDGTNWWQAAGTKCA
ncbi:MAG: hypothetical protein ACYC3S_17880 [Chloroflexota bacterium]